MEFLKKLPDNFVNLCITSPPYWSLRDYGVEGQIGLEPDFREYVSKLLRVFVELKRVLKTDGSFYLNLGDTYSGSLRGYGSKRSETGFQKPQGIDPRYPNAPALTAKVKGILPKCMMGIPWRVALALIRNDWILRNAIIWHKPNALPSSVKDRLNNTYEHVFHFVKSKKYYYNLDVIRVPHKSVTIERVKKYIENKEHFDPNRHKKDSSGLSQAPIEILENSAKKGLNPLGKNPGDVYVGKLAENSEQYGSPRVRRARENFQDRDYNPKGKNPGDVISKNKQDNVPSRNITIYRGFNERWRLRQKHDTGKNPGDFWIINTRGFKGAHFAVYPEELLHKPMLSSSRVNDVVLDPFIGSGTTAVVARKFGRRFLGCDINPEYVRIAGNRLTQVVV